MLKDTVVREKRRNEEEYAGEREGGKREREREKEREKYNE